MNPENQQLNKIKEQIFEKIKSGEVNMKSKYYFLIKIILLAVTIFVTFLLSAFIVSYVLFSIKTSGNVLLLGFGARGFYHFILTLPWIVLCVDILLILFLDWLLKSFRFGYNSPVLFLFIGTLASITLLAYLINLTSFHNSVMRMSEDRRIPVAGDFYKGLKKSHGGQGVFLGEVISINGTSTFYAKYSDYDRDVDDTVRVVLPDGFSVYSIYLSPGDHIFIAGDKNLDEIRAYGLRKLTEEK